jgi:hypothetical protein
MANKIFRSEYIALVGSFFLVGLEAIIRILTLALRRFLPFLIISYATCTNMNSIINNIFVLSSFQATLQPPHLTRSPEVRVEEVW